MAPQPSPQAEAVLTALASLTSCTPATAVQLKELLLSPENASSQSTKTATTRKPPLNGTRTVTRPAPARAKAKAGNGMSDKEKVALATQVINLSLKLLGDAAKPPPPTPSKQRPVDGEPPLSVARRQLRRSSSMPMSPLQPRTLNRTSTSPMITTKTKRPAQPISSSTGCLATVECARVAFAALRRLQDGGLATLPELQVEQGMSSLISRLINLGMLEQASEELRLLKTRLQPPSTPAAAAPKPSRTAPKSTTIQTHAQEETFPELLSFTNVNESKPNLTLVITTQLQVLKILAALKKPAFTEAALPYLTKSQKSSPLNLLIRLADIHPTERPKVARQLETYSHHLLSLVPNVATKDDGVAMESRISVSPANAAELATAALEARLTWWKLAGHKGDAEKEVFLPLAKLLSAYHRRTRTEGISYDLCHKAFRQISELAVASGYMMKVNIRSSVAAVHRLLVQVSRESGRLEEAISWAVKLREMVDKETDSSAKYLAVLSQLLALYLKDPRKYMKDDSLLKEVLEGLVQNLKGETTELEEMLQQVNGVRRVAVNLVTSQCSSDALEKLGLRESTRNLLETFIYQCVPYCMRWLGKPPASESTTKDFLRYEQRRQTLNGMISHVLDSAFAVTKVLIDDRRAEWGLMDTMLSNSLILLDYMGDIKPTSTGPSFQVKISHLYSVYYQVIRREGKATDELEAFRALRRSIDCIKHRSAKEKSQGKLLVKLEQMAEACKASGRLVDALGALQSIRTTLVDDGVLTTISKALERSPPCQAWNSDNDSKMLSRALSSIANLEQIPLNWAGDHPEIERAAVLEHQLYFIILGGVKQELATPSHPCVESLLEIYYPTRYPLRRLRTLIAVFAANADDTSIRDAIQPQIEAAIGLVENRDLGEDANLDGYFNHYRTMYASILGFALDTPDLEALRGCLTSWSTMLDSCTSKEQLIYQVDDPASLLTRLGSIADVARTMGQDGIVTFALELQTRLARIMSDQDIGNQLVHESALATQYILNGDCFKAEASLAQMTSYLEACPSVESVVSFHLSYTEYYLAVSKYDMAESHLGLARVAGTKQQQAVGFTKHARQVVVARASYLQSMVDVETGNAHNAMLNARNSVKALTEAWNRLERQAVSRSNERRLACNTSEVAADDLSSFMDASCTSTSTELTQMVPTARIWNLFVPLFRALSRLSAMYAHHGMFRKTMYYAEQAHMLAKNMDSTLYMALAEAWLGSVYLKADQATRASNLIVRAKARIPESDKTYRSILLDCELGRLYGEMKDFESEQEMLKRAEAKMQGLAVQQSQPVQDDNEEKKDADVTSRMSKLSIKERSQVVRKPRAPATRRQPAVAKKVKEDVVPKIAPVVQNTVVTSLKATLMVQKVEALLNNSDWNTAKAMLQDMQVASTNVPTLLSERIIRAACLLGNSMEAMSSDAVLSVIHDSTLSYPSVCASISDRGDRRSLAASPPLVKGKVAGTVTSRAAEANTRSFIQELIEAQECLVEAQGMAAMTGDGSLLHRVSAMLQSAVLLLSAASSASPRLISHPGHATSSVEIARNLTWRRERKVLPLETSSETLEWPSTTANLPDSRRTSLGISVDMGRFQHDYIDIIPKEWNVISIYLSDNKQDLRITKMQAGQSPFVIQLPLDRANSRDVDNEVFNFEQGRSEMLEIIKLANESSHTARNMSDQGCYSEWWAEREALDARLQQLLANIDHVWLGGFRGIFTPHQRRAGMVAKFHKSFQTILDKHLPSRRQVRGKRSKAAKPASSSSAPVKITLDPRILELFIGLGDANEPGCDMDDALNDLLYFVVDILQFHGERNAYDEIDFDSMVVETFDALRSCHATAKSSAESDLNVHTILVLDKSLHTFPWESLPCMQGRAVSRIASLACLRRLLLERDSPSAAGATPSSTAADAPRISPTGHRVSPSSGTYILNPSADLTATQAVFEQPFRSNLGTSWSRVVGRTPTEPEFEAALAQRDILLYFGHGSGAQYIRDRAVRTLDRCRATAFLMGCGSASLVYNGQFEVHGPAWNYMLAGCPAVVGTLWDVTDKDIDRFACQAFEEWGLFPRGTFAQKKKGRGKGGATVEGTKTPRKTGGRTAAAAAEDSPGPTSLVQAVAAAREAPRFRYLTAASVVVYGIPVYIASD